MAKIHSLNFLLFLALSSSPLCGFANDHEETSTAESEQAAEPNREESGGGQAEVKSSMAPWMPTELKIQELYSKIKSKESVVKSLLEEKDHVPNNSPKLQTIVKDIVKEHKELRRLVEDYEKQINILKYRFPERNAKTARTYERIEVKSIDDMEKALGIDGKLNRNLRNIRSQYKSDTKPTVVQEAHVPPSAKPEVKKEQSIIDASSVILGR